MNGVSKESAWPPPFRLLVVDDHPVVLFGLRLLFGEHVAFRIVAEAATAAQAREAAETHKPDFVVTDLVMGERDGIDLVEDLVTIHPPVGVLVYSSRDEAHYARPSGRCAWLPVQDRGAGARCRRAGSQIAAGEVTVSPVVQMGFVKSFAARDGAGLDLSGREHQVLDQIGRGASLQAIARDLGITVQTVGTYRERSKLKFGFDGLRGLRRYVEERLDKPSPR